MKLVAMFAVVAMATSPVAAQKLAPGDYKARERVFENAKTDCKMVIDTPGEASTLLDTIGTARGYSQSERLLLSEYCLLYAMGRVDRGR